MEVVLTCFAFEIFKKKCCINSSEIQTALWMCRKDCLLGRLCYLIPFPHRICCSQIQLFWCLRMHLAEQDQCLVETCTNNMCEGKHSVSVWSSLDSIQLSETMQRPVSCNQCKNKTTMYFIPSQQKLLPSSCFAEPSTTLISNGFLPSRERRNKTCEVL